MPRDSKQTVLIVDDMVANIMILGESLGDEVDVRVATSGDEALAIATSDEPPDLILLDIMMPGMDGYEVCRRLKLEDSTRDIPVIFITAKDEERDEARGLALGAVDYIKKPFSPPIVRARVRTQLELKRKTDLLERMALLDGLTCIPNRRHFGQVLDAEWRRGARAASWLSLVMIDIDHFKAYNDHYGHLAGDRCLQRVAGAIAEAAQRASDLAFRYGGEEFAVLLPGSTLEGATVIAERIRERVAALGIEHDGSSVADQVTLSLGVATVLPEPEDDPQQLVAAADAQLYRAKQTGRNRVVARDETAK